MNGQCPEWWTPGMTDADAQVWEAAQRSADSAPTLRPGDDVYEAARPVLGGWLTKPAREERGAA